jgi:hypothetical protein
MGAPERSGALFSCIPRKPRGVAFEAFNQID